MAHEVTHQCEVAGMAGKLELAFFHSECVTLVRVDHRFTPPPQKNACRKPNGFPGAVFFNGQSAGFVPPGAKPQGILNTKIPTPKAAMPWPLGRAFSSVNYLSKVAC